MIGNGAIPSVIGEMFIKHPGIDITLTLADTWYPISGIEKGVEKEMTVNETTGVFTMKQDGAYKFDGVASITPNLGVLIHFAMFKNSAEVEKIETALDFQNNQDLNTFSGTGIVELVKDDEITVSALANSAGKILSVEHLNISLHKI